MFFGILNQCLFKWHVCIVLCVYRGRIGLHHLPGGDFYTSRLNLLGHPLLHHVVDFGHWQRGESKQLHGCHTEETHNVAAKGKSRNSRSMKTEMCKYSWWNCAQHPQLGNLINGKRLLHLFGTSASWKDRCCRLPVKVWIISTYSSWLCLVLWKWFRKHQTNTDTVGLRKALRRCFHSSWFSKHMASSLVLLHPSWICQRMSVWDIPLSRCPCVGSQCTNLLASSFWCLWQCPASVIPLTTIFLLTVGIPSYRILLVRNV